MIKKAVWLICGLMSASTAGFGSGESGFPILNPKPVFMVHGLMVGSSNLAILEALIKLHNPRTVVHNTNAYSNRASTTPLQEQLDGTLGQEFLNFSNTYPGGIHLIGHSQGALLARTLLQNYPQHNVCNFISICGPQAGQYGVPNNIAALTSFGELPPLVNTASAIFYTAEAQKNLSVANFWKDPTQPELYLRNNTFLPYYNNEIWTKKSECYREALLKLDHFIALLGPDDGIIETWTSADFSYFNRCKTLVNITHRQIYTEDRLGLRTLDEQGRFIINVVPGVQHADFIRNSEVIRKFILPWLN